MKPKPRAHPGARATATLAVVVLAAGAFALAAFRARVPSAHAGGGESGDPPPIASAASTVARVALDGTRPAPLTAPDVPTRLPSSLEGTRADGDVAVDGAGHLVVSAQTKRYFDYFLLASGQEPAPTLRARVDRATAARVGAVAHGETMALFDRYGVFRDEAKRLVAPMQATAADYEARITQLRALRRRVLGRATAGAFFADDEELEDRQLAYGRSDAAAPATPPLAESPAALVERDRAWRELPRESRWKARAESLGPEAAARLAALDDEDDAWSAKMAAYRAARAALLARGARETYAADLEALRAQLFSAEERVRVETLDRIEAQPPRR